MTFILLLFPFICNASAYWMEVKGSGKIDQPVQIRIYYGNIEESGKRKPQTGAELALTGEFRLFIVDHNGLRTSIPIFLKGDGWEGTYTPHQKGVYQILGINDTHPVVDRSKTGGKNVLPVDYLCAAYQVESVETVSKPVQFLDILTVDKGEQVLVKAFNNGATAVAGTKIRVFNPDNWEKELSIGEHGEALFTPTMKGLYIIRQDWTVPESGIYKGVPYASIRHRCNYFYFFLKS